MNYDRKRKAIAGIQEENRRYYNKKKNTHKYKVSDLVIANARWRQDTTSSEIFGTNKIKRILRNERYSRENRSDERTVHDLYSDRLHKTLERHIYNAIHIDI